MRAVIQRVLGASVDINGNRIAEIGIGFLVFIGIETNDDDSDIQWLGDKILKMRIFKDSHKPMNISLEEVGGAILVVSQFTLHASTKKGNRPSFIRAAGAEKAEALYMQFVSYLSSSFHGQIATGRFGEDMQVQLLNDGPITIIIDSKNKE